MVRTFEEIANGVLESLRLGTNKRQKAFKVRSPFKYSPPVNERTPYRFALDRGPTNNAPREKKAVLEFMGQQQRADHIFGTKIVPYDLFRDRLGIMATAVWEAMRHRRCHETGLLWHSAQWVGNHVKNPRTGQKIGRWNARRALRRLKEVGLMRPMFWELASWKESVESIDLDLLSGATIKTTNFIYRSKLVHKRSLHGALVVTAPMHRCLGKRDQLAVIVPLRVYENLRKRCSWGGDRRSVNATPDGRAAIMDFETTSRFVFNTTIQTPNPPGYTPTWNRVDSLKKRKTNKISSRPLTYTSYKDLRPSGSFSSKEEIATGWRGLPPGRLDTTPEPSTPTPNQDRG